MAASTSLLWQPQPPVSLAGLRGLSSVTQLFAHHVLFLAK